MLPHVTVYSQFLFGINVGFHWRCLFITYLCLRALCRKRITSSMEWKLRQYSYQTCWSEAVSSTCDIYIYIITITLLYAV